MMPVDAGTTRVPRSMGVKCPGPGVAITQLLGDPREALADDRYPYGG
jgi:hypothetical protein